MDEKYKVVYRFNYRYSFEHIIECDSLTEAVDKFNKVINVYRDLDYVKIIWGNSELQFYEFE